MKAFESLLARRRIVLGLAVLVLASGSSQAQTAQSQYYRRTVKTVVPSNPATDFSPKRQVAPHPNGVTTKDLAPGLVNPGGGMNPLPQHGNINGGTDLGYRKVGVIFGAKIYSGNFTDAIELYYYIPSQPDNLYRQGDYKASTGRIGGSGGVDRGDYYCPQGYAAVGLQGASGTAAVDRLGLICGKIGNLSQVVALPVFGGSGGAVFNDNCGSIHSLGFLTGVRVRAGDWMDSIQGLCQAGE